MFRVFIMLNQKQKKLFLFKLISIALIIALNIPTTFAATLLPVNNFQERISDDIVERNVADYSTIQMVATETIEAYEEPTIQSSVIYSITGGTVVLADMYSLNNEFITIEYCGKICYADGAKFKAIIGNENVISQQIDAIYKKYKYDAEYALGACVKNFELHVVEHVRSESRSGILLSLGNALSYCCYFFYHIFNSLIQYL